MSGILQRFLLLWLLVMAETLCGSYLLQETNWISAASVAHLLAGLGIGLFFLLYSPTEPAGPDHTWLNRLIAWGTLAAFASITVYYCVDIFRDFPIDYRYSDNLPQIAEMNRRFWNGEKVYSPIWQIWGGKLPPYLPMMWLPFGPAAWLEFDMRWTSVVFLLAGLSLAFLLFPFRKGNPVLTALALVPVFFLVNYLFAQERMTAGWTEEGVAIGYYLFLGYALTRRSPLLKGVAIALCLLSRFSLLFWALFYLPYAYFFESKKDSLITAAAISAMILVLFLIPFGFADPRYFLNIPQLYHAGAGNVWSWEPFHVYSSLGLAKFFDPSSVGMLQRLQVVLAVTAPLVVFAFLALRRGARPPLAALGCLKISLVVFYSFLSTPYYYLFLISAFLSCPMLFAWYRGRG